MSRRRRAHHWVVATTVGRLALLVVGAVALRASSLPAQSGTARPGATAVSDSASLVLVERTAAAYRGARTIRAEFTQLLRNPRTRTSFTSRGEFFQRGSERFAFVFSEPPEDRVVSDGQVLWLYSPSTAKGQVFKMPRAAGAGMDLATSVLRDPARRYVVTAAGDSTIEDQKVRAVLLVPRSADAPFMRATLWLDSKSALVRRAEFTEASGLVRTIAFTRIRTGSTLPRNVFTFTPPAGVRVIDQAAMLGGSTPRP